MNTHSDELEVIIKINSEDDILSARQKARTLALGAGFSLTDATLVATAVSELARNIILYARQGEIEEKIVRGSDRVGIVIVARDSGPGIHDVERAMQIGYSTSRSLGLGLPGVKRLMDDFEIVSKAGQGTIVTARKWKR